MTTDFAIFPSAEKLAVTILKTARDTDGIFDDISVTPHIGTKLPANPDYTQGVIKVVRAGGMPVQEGRWMDAPSIQVDVWGQTKEIAHDVAARARVALRRAEGKRFGDAFVTGTKDGIQLGWDFDPMNLKPRYTVGVYLYLHLSAQA